MRRGERGSENEKSGGEENCIESSLMGKDLFDF